MESGLVWANRSRWLFAAAGVGLIFLCLLPGDTMLAHWGKSWWFVHSRAWMHPFTWPLAGLGIVMCAAAFSAWLRRNIAWAMTATGIASIVILFWVQPIVQVRLLEMWAPGFASAEGAAVQMSVLPVHLFVAITLAIGPAIYYVDFRLAAGRKGSGKAGITRAS